MSDEFYYDEKSQKYFTANQLIYFIYNKIDDLIDAINDNVRSTKKFTEEILKIQQEQGK